MVTSEVNGDKRPGSSPFDQPGEFERDAKSEVPSEVCASCLIAEMDKYMEWPGAILVSNLDKLKEGSTLIGDIKLGKFLGAGVQARVYDLVKADGTETGKVIKIAHSDVGHSMINMIWIGMEREWELGTQLRAALQEPDGSLPGFMKVCDALVSSSGTGKDGGPKRVQFAGMILEKLYGWEVYKRIQDPSFHNIHYIREMLFQVFSALDKAQREVGFFHADMGLRNVMETYPKLYSDISRAEMRALEREFRERQGDLDSANSADSSDPETPENSVNVIRIQGLTDVGCEDCGITAEVIEDADGAKWLRPTKNCRVVKKKVGFTCCADGSRMPLGPNLEFKIIDYGVSEFDELLAQTTGGYKGRENYKKMRQLFEAEHLTLGSESRSSVMELDTNPIKEPGQVKKKWFLTQSGFFSQHFKVKTAPKGTQPVASADLDNMSVASSVARSSPSAERFTWGRCPTKNSTNSQQSPNNNMRRPSSPPSLAEDPELSRKVTARMLHTKMSTVNPNAPMTTAPKPKMGPIEVMYRHFWRRKGDAFHLLLGLAILLDDRVWPKEDEEEVMLFASLVHHVTGISIHAAFTDESEEDEKNNCRFGRVAGLVHLKRKAKLRPYGLNGRWYTKLRRFHMMLKSHFHPYNSGLTAAEALTAPFFGGGNAPARAKLPVCVEAAFPRSNARS